MKIDFPYGGIPSLQVNDDSLIAVLAPRIQEAANEPESMLIERALRKPVGAPRLAELAAGKKSILILVDDYTRITPVHLILPAVLEEIRAAGASNKQVIILVASGTHRPMTTTEKSRRFGSEICSEYRVLDHSHDDLSRLVQLPTTPRGTEIWVNRAVVESDLVVGIGHIVPHRVAGFSGGGKIVQPGVCGAVTTGQTHWLSAQFEGAQIMGRIDNPVRREIEDVAKAAGLSFIANAVLDAHGRVVTLACGSSLEAYRAGSLSAMDVFGVPMERTAEIVIADSYPSDMEMWQASKGVYSADLALERGGVLILVTPCTEGVSAEFPELARIGYRPFAEVDAMIRSGELKDLTLAAHLVHVGRVIREKATGIIVSPGIDEQTVRSLGFRPAKTPQEALAMAFELKGKGASMAVLRNGGEIMPIPKDATSHA